MTPEKFDQLTDLCARWTGREWDGTTVHLTCALDMQAEYIAVLDAYGAWLSTLRERALSAGRDWDRGEMLRQSRLAGDLTTPPRWLTGEVA